MLLVPWAFCSAGLGSGATGGGFVAWAGGKWLVAIKAAGLAGRVRTGLLATVAPPVFAGGRVAAGAGPSLEWSAVVVVFAEGVPCPPAPFVGLPSSIVRGALGAGILAVCETSACGFAAVSSPPLDDGVGKPVTSGAAGGLIFATAAPSVAGGGARAGAGSVRGAAESAAGAEP